MSNIPTLDAYRDPNCNDLAVWCIYCERWHHHGAHNDSPDCAVTTQGAAWNRPCTCPPGSGDGHRVAHCHDPASPYDITGYWLREVVPDADLPDCPATAPPGR
jgi:hypothetical protein